MKNLSKLILKAKEHDLDIIIDNYRIIVGRYLANQEDGIFSYWRSYSFMDLEKLADDIESGEIYE